MYDVLRKTLLVLESELRAAPFDSHLESDSRLQCSQVVALEQKQQFSYFRERNEKKLIFLYQTKKCLIQYYFTG